jgi:hypothetical protein
MQFDTVQGLTAARTLLSPENAWTQGEFARIDGFLPAHSAHPRADCFCLRGAIERVASAAGACAIACATGPEYHDAMAAMCGAIEAVILPLGYRDIISFNDKLERTHAEVLEVLDQAIANERESAERVALANFERAMQ